MSDEQHNDNSAESSTDQAMSIDDAADLGAMAKAGELEIPVGAEQIAEALSLLADERANLDDTLRRTAAELQNFRRRAEQNEVEARRQGMTGVVQSVLTVVDYFGMALTQDPEKTSAEQIIGGVKMIQGEFLRVLGNHGVTAISPNVGDEFDPQQHEAVEQRETIDVEPGRVIETRQDGYTLHDRVVRPAKVVVAKAADESGEG